MPPVCGLKNGKYIQYSTVFQTLPENKISRYQLLPIYSELPKEDHPVGYVFLVVFGIAVFMTPMLLFGWVTWEEEENGWLLLGLVGSMIFGVGLFNFVAILINQYLGHLVSLLSFLIGGVLIWVSLAQVGIL